MREILLQTGEFFFGVSPGRIRTVLGSCVAITMWHRARKMGGMCHYLLPAGERCPERAPGMYAAEAIKLFVSAIQQSGAQRRDFEVKLFGGGRMFKTSMPECTQPCDPQRRTNCTNVPCKNVLAGREMLSAYGFSVSTEHVGGAGSRDLIFDLHSGEVLLKHGPSVTAASRS